MRKSILLFNSLLALVAIGALPANASASPVLKNLNTGVALKKGDGVLGAFTNHGFFTASGNVLCPSYLTGEVKENTGTKIAIEFTTIWFAGFNVGTTGDTCTTGLTGPDGKSMEAKVNVDGSAPWCLEATAARAGEAWLIGGACGGKNYPVRLNIELYEQSVPHSLVTTCTYEAETEEGKGTYTTKASPVMIAVPTWNFARKAGSTTYCPAKGNLAEPMQVTSNNGEAELTVIE